MNSTALEMIYGRPENYRAKVAVKSGELIQLGTRAAVACCDIAKGETGPVYVRGDFFFGCAPDYECDDASPIAYDFKARRFVSVGSPNSLVIGAALFPTPKGSKIDHQTYFRSIWTERAFVEDQILNRLFVRWFREWQLSNRELPLADAMFPWQGHWIWPHTDDLDMLNAAHVQALNLQNRTTTLATEYARQGKNWKTELEQIKKEQAYLKKLGL